MKSINDYINEASSSHQKYLVEYYKASKNEFFADSKNEIINKLKNIFKNGIDPKKEYYAIIDNSKSNFSESDACVNFYGEKSYYYRIMNGTDLTSKQKDNLKRKYKNILEENINF